MEESECNALSRREVVGGVGISMAAAGAGPTFAQEMDQPSTSTHDSELTMEDPRSKYSKPPFWKQTQPWPGLARDMGRVEMWRGGCRPDISVSAPFVWRCLSGSTMTPFPHPAHRTGHADLPHPALGQDFHAFTHGTSCPSRHRRTSPKCP